MAIRQLVSQALQNSKMKDEREKKPKVDQNNTTFYNQSYINGLYDKAVVREKSAKILEEKWKISKLENEIEKLNKEWKLLMEKNEITIEDKKSAIELRRQIKIKEQMLLNQQFQQLLHLNTGNHQLQPPKLPFGKEAEAELVSTATSGNEEAEAELVSTATSGNEEAEHNDDDFKKEEEAQEEEEEEGGSRRSRVRQKKQRRTKRKKHSRRKKSSKKRRHR
jgi:hypothetical protein